MKTIRKFFYLVFIYGLKTFFKFLPKFLTKFYLSLIFKSDFLFYLKHFVLI